jgi:hypothetical protein
VHNGNIMIDLQATNHLHIYFCPEHSLQSPEKETRLKKGPELSWECNLSDRGIGCHSFRSGCPRPMSVKQHVNNK